MKRHIYILAFVILNCVLTCSIQAQVIIEDQGADTLTVFSPEKPLPIDTLPTLKSVIHFGFFHVLRGRYPFFYEKSVGSSMGLSFGVGLAHADFFRKAHTEILYNNVVGKMKFGLHSEVLVKRYFSGLAIEDSYVAANVKFTSFNFEKEENLLLSSFQERHFEYLVLTGIQLHQDDRKLVFDYYAGIGISNIYITKDEIINVSGQFEPINSVSARGYRLIMRIGLKIGFQIN